MINGNRTKSNRGRSPRDLYKTPPELATAAMIRLSLDEYSRIPFGFGLDAGCGNGVWGKAASNIVDIVYGIDLVPTVLEKDMWNFGMVYTGDFLSYSTLQPLEIIFGNPPYSLAEEFVRHSFELLKEDGLVYFLLRLSFLEGIKRCRGLFKEFPLKKVYVCSRRPSFFSSDGERHTTDTLAYAIFLWQKGYRDVCPDLDFLDWDYK